MNNQKKIIDFNTKLRSSFKQYRAFCKVLTDGYILLGADSSLVDCNQEFASMLEVKKKELIQSTVLSDFFNIFLGSKKTTLDQLVGVDKPKRIDQVTLCTNLKKLLVVISFFPLVEDGVYLGSIVLFRNMTDESILQFKYKDKYLEAMHDPLTGLKNRAYFMKEIDKLFDKQDPKQETQESSVVLLDIDYFKKVNDVYGHQAGDQILIEVSETLANNVFDTDTVGRYGGEEFIIILPNVSLENAKIVCERIRKKIEAKTIIFGGKEIKITASFGVSSTKASGDDNPSLILKRADEALYEAKNYGRNQTVSK